MQTRMITRPHKKFFDSLPKGNKPSALSRKTCCRNPIMGRTPLLSSIHLHDFLDNTFLSAPKDRSISNPSGSVAKFFSHRLRTNDTNKKVHVYKRKRHLLPLACTKTSTRALQVSSERVRVDRIGTYVRKSSSAKVQHFSRALLCLPIDHLHRLPPCGKRETFIRSRGGGGAFSWPST